MQKEDDVDDIVLQTQNILKKIQEQMRLTEEVLSLSKPSFDDIKLPDHAKSMIIPQKRQPKNIFKIRESVQEFVNLDQIIEKKPEKSPFDESCSICNSKIYFNKYICIVCDCVLCPKCEINHEHPVLKCKFSQLSSLESIYIYINTKNQEVKNNRNNSSFFCAGANLPEICLKSRGRTTEIVSRSLFWNSWAHTVRSYELGMSNI